MKKHFWILVLSFMLASCAGEDKSSNAETEPTQAVTTTVPVISSTVTEPVKPQPEYKTITAEVTDYREGKLFFSYEGKDYALAAEDDMFASGAGSYTDGREPTLPVKIIKNRFGEKVTGKLVITEDMSRIIKCDVVSPNGKEYEGIYYQRRGDDGETVIDPALYYIFEKTSPSTGVIYNSEERIECDLNDLSQFRKLYVSNEYKYTQFTAYKFKSGNMILTGLEGPYKPKEDGFLTSDRQQPHVKTEFEVCYFGTVTKNENGTAEVLINDGISTVTAPSYFNDGEVKPGERVMVMTGLYEEKLYGTGGHLALDKAVFFTDEKYYNLSLRYFLKYEDIDNYAYAFNGDEHTSELVYYPKDTLKKKIMAR